MLIGASLIYKILEEYKIAHLILISSKEILINNVTENKSEIDFPLTMLGAPKTLLIADKRPSLEIRHFPLKGLNCHLLYNYCTKCHLLATVEKSSLYTYFRWNPLSTSWQHPALPWGPPGDTTLYVAFTWS